jgi:hypothetical protein
MKKVNVDQLQQGMKVAQKVENKNGMVLLPEGIELTDVNIGRLKKWGVDFVYVEGQDDGSAGGPNVPELKLTDEYAAYITHKFEFVKDDPIMAGIMNAVKLVASKKSS